MRNNIAKLYLSNFLTGLVFWYAVEKLFMYSIGITPFGVSVNAVVLVIVTSLFDVPLGVMADRWSRKYMLVLGILALAVSSLVAGSAHNLVIYTIGTIFYGLYICCTSGTFQAITYDILEEQGKTASYAKHQGASYGLFLTGAAISSPLGGFLAHSFGYRSTFYLSAGVCIINALVLLGIHEPGFHKAAEQTKLWHHIGSTSRLLLGNKTLLYLSSILLVAGMLRSSLNEYAGLYFIAVGFGAIGSGWANGGKWLFSALGQFLSGKLARYWPWAVGVFFVAFAVMSAWRTPLGLLFFYLATFAYGVLQNEAQALIQKELTSGVRATALSLINFGTSSLMIPLGLAFGALAQHYSVFTAYQMFAAIGLVYLLVWLVWRQRASVTTATPATLEPTVLT